MDSYERNLLAGKENEAIHKILMGILEKWRMEVGAGEEDLEKTVILSSESIGKREIPLQSKTIEVIEEAIAETVILQPKDHRPGPSIPSPAVKSTEPDSMQRSEEFPGKDEFLEETVILKTSKIREKANE